MSRSFPIRVVARRTGITEATLRMWERRYGFPDPSRRPSGARMYSVEQVEALELIAKALELGYRAGEVVAKPADELAQLIAEARGSHATGEIADVAGLMALVEAEDPPVLAQALRRALAALGIRRFVRELAEPLLVEVGERWHAGELSIRHEHFLTEAMTTELRQALALAGGAGRPLVMLATLPGERHGLGLQLTALYLASWGAGCRSLGVDTPPREIAEAAVAQHADAVGLSVSMVEDHHDVVGDLSTLRSELPDSVPLWVGGQGASKIKLPKGAELVGDWTDLEAMLKSWTPS